MSGSLRKKEDLGTTNRTNSQLNADPIKIPKSGAVANQGLSIISPGPWIWGLLGIRGPETIAEDTTNYALNAGSWIGVLLVTGFM